MKKLFSNPKLAIGLTIMLLYVVIAIVGPIILPYDPNTVTTEKYLPNSLLHPLGTDWLGRDVLRQLVAGTGSVMKIAFYSAALSVFVGTVLGIVSGYMGGIVDKFIMAITNIFLSVPSFPVYLVLASIMAVKSPFSIALIVSIWSWTGLCRSIRVQILSLKERDFIQICRVMHMSTGHIIFKELMPNILSYVIINFVSATRNAILASIGIMLVGLAAYDPTNWGAIISAARLRGLFNPGNVKILLYPLTAIVIFQVAALMVVNGLDELLNPRLKVM